MLRATFRAVEDGGATSHSARKQGSSLHSIQGQLQVTDDVVPIFQADRGRRGQASVWRVSLLASLDSSLISVLSKRTKAWKSRLAGE